MFEHAPSRRGLLIGAGALAALATPALAREGAVVDTAQGRYRGMLLNGVHSFKGMRYGAATGRGRRFMPPAAAEPFAGVRDAFAYGDQSPQVRSPLADATVMSEDCLRINVWTPNPGDGRKRPVLLWFHGGGFEAGSGSSAIYDGSRMVRRRDVVVCTINHRLNVFGFCDLSSYLGETFAQSGNVGYLDLVAAMAWVRENIGAFGGDPDNVMIYGQSGGGRKVSVCFAGAEANGLFDKGVVQSGSHLLVQTPDQSRALTAALLTALQIDAGDGRKLQDVPQDQLVRAQLGVIAAARYRFEPVMDGIAFKAHPFVPTAPVQTARVPMLLGTTQTELSNQLGRDEAVYSLDEAGLRARLSRILPEGDIDEAIRVFGTTTPGGSPTEIFFKIASWRSYIKNATTMAEARAALNGADNPTWMYQLTWRSPAEGGRRYSQHTLDLPFMFDNVGVATHLTGPESAETHAMTEAMAGAWLAFARTGNPNHPGLPAWATYDTAARPVLNFEVPPQVVHDPLRPEREFMERYPPLRATASEA